jgi:tryptophan 2,3-dioxygenase
MTMNLLGKKPGTGGSSGHDYLLKTAASHHVFKDFHNITTLLIPRSSLPELPKEVKKQLGFYFTEKTKN